MCNKTTRERDREKKQQEDEGKMERKKRTERHGYTWFGYMCRTLFECGFFFAGIENYWKLDQLGAGKRTRNHVAIG